MFTDAFSPGMQLCTSALDPKLSTYLACALLVRGSPQHVGISDVTHNVNRLRPDVRMVHWNADGFKIGLCDVPPVGQPYSLLCLANNCGVRHTFSAMRDRFMKLFRVKAHVHHYTQMNVDLGVFNEALASLDSVVADYVSMENAQAPADPPKRLVPAFDL
jgi:tubulin epsilon